MAADDLTAVDETATTDDVQSRDGQDITGNGQNDDTELPEGAKKAIQAARKAERDARRIAAEAQARIKEFEDRDKSEAEKAQERSAELERRAQDAEHKLLRHEVAASKQLPADAIDLLHGGTKEELEAQADRILSLTQANRTGFDGGTRGSDAPPSDMNHMLRRAAGRT